MRWLPALLLAACGGLPTGVVDTRFELATTSQTASGPATPADRATFTRPLDLETPTALHIDGPPGPLTDGVRAVLAASPHAVRGSLVVVLTTLPTIADTRGTGPVVVTIAAVWPDPPNVVRAEINLEGTLTWTHGGPREAVPGDLGRRLGEQIDAALARHAPKPRVLPPLTAATQIAVAQNLACTLHEDGVVRCWGSDQPVAAAIPTPVRGLARAVEIDAGSQRICARLADGAVRCLGDHLGDDDQPHAPVCDIPDATAIAVGALSACAILADTSVRCWPIRGDFEAPCGGAPSVPIPGVKATAIAAGFDSELARTADHQTLAWTFKTGPGREHPAPIPEPIPEFAASPFIAANFDPCAIDGAGAIRCLEEAEPPALHLLARIPGATSVALSSHRGCARSDAGVVECWATGLAGETADNRLDSETLHTPVVLAGHGRIRDVDVGLAAACIVDEAGAPWCWAEFSDYVLPEFRPVAEPQRIAMPW